MAKGPRSKKTAEFLIKQTPSDSSERLCDKEGCCRLGEYRAPKDNTLSEYYWFCLEHVKEYNAQWDFYKDMDEFEIEKERKEDVCWHRPTWEFGKKNSPFSKFSDPFNLKKEAFDEESDKEAYHFTPLTQEEKKLQEAVLLLESEFPLNREKIRQNYKRLAKTYHPDSNGGDKALEEKFKEMTQAYQLIMKTLENVKK